MAKDLKKPGESQEFTEQQKKDISNARSRAVQQAWKQEKEYVKDGKGTRDWSKEQQQEILKNGKLHGYEGHHMRSVSNGKTYEEQMKIAGDKNNIQFLEKTEKNNEHIKAHGGNTKNRTNGYYDTKTGKTNDFGKGEPRAPKAEKLSTPIKQESNTKKEGTKKESHVDEYGVDMSKADKKSDHSQNRGKSR